MSEHDFEPIRGLPGNLPEGETLLWQGAPRWTALACSAFHIRAVAAYFVLMLAWRTGGALAGGATASAAFGSALSVTPLALLALGILAFLAWLNSSTTVYTITSKRVVLRIGAAVPKAINIPFSIIESAAVKASGEGVGDLALTLKAPNKIAVLQLWPHVRPWRMSAPQPTFRAIGDAKGVGAILASAMQPEVPIALVPTGAPVRSRDTGGVMTPPGAVAA